MWWFHLCSAVDMLLFHPFCIVFCDKSLSPYCAVNGTLFVNSCHSFVCGCRWTVLSSARPEVAFVMLHSTRLLLAVHRAHQSTAAESSSHTLYCIAVYCLACCTT